MQNPINKASYDAQLSNKTNIFKTHLNAYFNQDIDIFPSSPKHYRMRAEFRVWHDGPSTYHIMFNQETKEKYRVDQLPSASLLINQVMPVLIDFICDCEVLRKKLFQIDYLSSTTNELVVSLLYHKTLDEVWQGEAEKLLDFLSQFGKINIIGRAKKQKLTLGRDHVIESLKIKERSYIFKQVENSFTQPNAHINIKMIEWVIDKCADENNDLLELYCGAGNFSIPLSNFYKQVLATEISSTSVNAAQFNIVENKAQNLKIARLSSEEFVQAFNQLREFYRLRDINLNDYNFKTVLVDPPRAGLDPTTLALVQRFETIVYISCNPETLFENMEVLSKTHKVKYAALFDQFPYTHHIEAGLVLTKR